MEVGKKIILLLTNISPFPWFYSFVRFQLSGFILIFVLCFQTTEALSKEYAFLTYPSFWKWTSETDLKDQIKKLTDLSESGANLNAKRKGFPILYWAIHYGHPKAVSALLNLGVNHKYKTFDNQTALHHAASYSTKMVLEDLLKAGLDLNDKDSNGDLPITWAIRIGKLDNVKFLIEHGSFLRFKNIYGQSIMHAAAISNNQSIIQLLFAEGISLDTIDDNGQVPLHLAARRSRSNFDGVRTLIELGANPNIQNINGITPFHLAYNFMGNCPNADQLMGLFFESGADINILDNKGLRYDEVGFALKYCHEWN